MVQEKKKLPGKNIQTPEFRLAFPYVFKPRPTDDPTKQPKFEITMLFPKDTDLSALKKACEQVMIEKFGPDKNQWPKSYRKPFRDGDESAHLTGFAGHTFVDARSSQPIGVVDERCVPIMDDNGLYAGCYARAIICPFWYDSKGNKGVSFFLNGIQRTKHGERFVNRPRPEEMFQQVEGAQASETEDDSGF